MSLLANSLKNPVVQQYGLELLFPIIGYLFFGWSFLLIVLFYLVDQLGNQVNFLARLIFVQRLFLPKKKWLLPILIAVVACLFVCELALLYHLFIANIYDCQYSFFYDEVRAFFLQEFWIFMPALVLVNYFKDKMTFYKTDLPYQESPEKLGVCNLIGLSNTFLLIGLIFLVWLFLKPNMLLLVILMAVFKLLNDLFILPQLKRRYFRKI